MIELCDSGGTFYGTLILNTSGTSNQPITYTNAPGQSPVISGSMRGDTIPVGTPAELLGDPGFENYPTGGYWVTSGGTWARVAGQRTGGSGSYVLQLTGNGTSPSFQQTITGLSPNTWYILRYWHVVSSLTCQFAPVDNFTDGGANYLQTVPMMWDTSNAPYMGSYHRLSSGSWVRRALIFRTAPGQTSFMLNWYTYNCTSGTLQLDDFSVQQIMWQSAGGNEYYLDLSPGPIDRSYVDYQAALNNVAYVATYLNGIPLGLGTSGSLTTGQFGLDAATSNLHINVGGDPTQQGDLEIPVVSRTVAANAKSYITISGLTLQYSASGGGGGGAIAALNFEGLATNWTVKNNLIQYHQSVGVMRDAAAHNNWSILYNRFDRISNGRLYAAGGSGQITQSTNSSTGSTEIGNIATNSYSGTNIDALGGIYAYNTQCGAWINGPGKVSDETLNPVSLVNNSILHTSQWAGGGHGVGIQTAGHGTKVKNMAIYSYWPSAAADWLNAFCISNSNHVQSDYNNLYWSGGSTAYLSLTNYTGQISSPSSPTAPAGCAYISPGLMCSTIAGYQALMASATINGNSTLAWTADGTLGHPADAHSISASPSWTISGAYPTFTCNFSLMMGDHMRGTADPAAIAALGIANLFDVTGKTRITDAANKLVVIPDIGAVQSQPQSGMGMGM